MLESSKQVNKPGIYSEIWDSQDSHLWCGIGQSLGDRAGGSWGRGAGLGAQDGMWHRDAGAHLPRGCHSGGSVPKDPHLGGSAQPQWPHLPPETHCYSSAINVYDRRERK